MKIPYNREISKLMTKCCSLAVEQYKTKDGVITPPEGYTQTASFKVFEILNNTNLDSQLKILKSKDLEKLELLDSTNLASELVVFKYKDLEELGLLSSTGLDLESRSNLIFCKPVYIGFALTSETNNIIALRGTQSVSEWIADATALKTYYDSSDYSRGKVHCGFKSLYKDKTFRQSSLSQQICEAARKFDSSKTCYVTGHSLGAALAVLAATDIALLDGLKDRVQMYNYGGPRVGNHDFASFYNNLIPNSYRVVNIVDLVPQLPLEYNGYLHVGEEWSYLWQTRNVGTNHYLNYLVNNYTYNYLPAVKKELEQQNPLTYPAHPLDISENDQSLYVARL